MRLHTGSWHLSGWLDGRWEHAFSKEREKAGSLLLHGHLLAKRSTVLSLLRQLGNARTFGFKSGFYKRHFPNFFGNRGLSWSVLALRHAINNSHFIKYVSGSSRHTGLAFEVLLRMQAEAFAIAWFE